MKIGLCIIATGKYDIFLKPILDSIKTYFFTPIDVTVYVFTDSETFYGNGLVTYYVPIMHEPFPLVTLNRYSTILKEERTFIEDKITHLFYCDADMLFVGKVGPEILPDDAHPGIVAVRHPGFINGGWGSPNCDPLSTAYVPEPERGTYFAGGFQGGNIEDFLKMCKALKEAIKVDTENGIMAEWHDESHFNRYLTDFRPGLVLGHEYCMPEDNITLPSPKLLALSKDHNAIRS